MAGGQGGSKYRGLGWTLSDKQNKFIKAYAGNATKAARKAGYKSPQSAARRNMENPHIQQLIKDRRDTEPETLKLVADRQERQETWTNIMRGDEKEEVLQKDGVVLKVTPKIPDRLKASELLGKSEGDFIDKVLTGEMTLEERIKALEDE